MMAASTPSPRIVHPMAGVMSGAILAQESQDRDVDRAHHDDEQRRRDRPQPCAIVVDRRCGPLVMSSPAGGGVGLLVDRHLCSHTVSGICCVPIADYTTARYGRSPTPRLDAAPRIGIAGKVHDARQKMGMSFVQSARSTVDGCASVDRTPGRVHCSSSVSITVHGSW